MLHIRTDKVSTFARKREDRDIERVSGGLTENDVFGSICREEIAKSNSAIVDLFCRRECQLVRSPAGIAAVFRHTARDLCDDLGRLGEGRRGIIKIYQSLLLDYLALGERVV